MENVIPYNWSPGYGRGRIIDNSLDKCCYILHSHLGHHEVNVPGVDNQSFVFVFSSDNFNCGGGGKMNNGNNNYRLP